MKTTAKTIVERVLSGLRFNYQKEDESELKAFSKLSDQCRVGAGERATRYESARSSSTADWFGGVRHA